MPKLLNLLLLFILVTPVGADDIKTEGDCSPPVIGNRANKIELNIQCNPTLEIVSWEGRINSKTENDFYNFLGGNEGRIVKIDAEVSANFVKYDDESETCEIRFDYRVNESGSDYLVNCYFHLGGYQVDGFYTARVYVQRTWHTWKLNRVSDGTVYSRNPKIVRYKSK